MVVETGKLLIPLVDIVHKVYCNNITSSGDEVYNKISFIMKLNLDFRSNGIINIDYHLTKPILDDSINLDKYEMDFSNLLFNPDGELLIKSVHIDHADEIIYIN